MTMNTEDRRMTGIAALALLFLLTILLGSQLPRLAQLLVAVVTLASIFGVTVQFALSMAPAARPFRLAFSAASVGTAVVMIATVLLDHSFHLTSRKILGLEPATTVLVFGITFWPFSYVILWTMGFNRAVLPPEKAKQVDALAQTPTE